eukprot:1824385-Pyramimonas_sp.AAC.2
MIDARVLGIGLSASLWHRRPSVAAQSSRCWAGLHYATSCADAASGWRSASTTGRSSIDGGIRPCWAAKCCILRPAAVALQLAWTHRGMRARRGATAVCSLDSSAPASPVTDNKHDAEQRAQDRTIANQQRDTSQNNETTRQTRANAGGFW